MRRIVALSVALGILLSSAVVFALSVRYENKDSEDYTFEVECSGSTKDVEFRGSTTATATLHSTSSGPCTIMAPNGEIEVNKDDRIIIKDGEVSIE